jgi:hypothetical protein
MQASPPTVGQSVWLKKLADGVNTNSYNNNFVSLNAAEPSLGLPPGYSTTNPLSTYFFPVFANIDSYKDSRKFTGYNSLFINGDNLTVPNLSAARLSAVEDSIFGKNVLIGQDLTVYGNISAQGDILYRRVIRTISRSLSVVSQGAGPAAYIYQTSGPGAVASFVAGNNTEVLHVGNYNVFQTPKVGINTSTPNVELTVNGSISSNSLVYVPSGNSNQWNSVFSTVYSHSAVWENFYPNIQSNFSRLSTQAFFLDRTNYAIKPTLGQNIATGEFSSILGGKNNNTNDKCNTFILGSNIVADKQDFTYVNNLESKNSICGNFFGDGSNLNGIKSPYTFGNTVLQSIKPLSGNNQVTQDFANVLGGCLNTSKNYYSTIAGGYSSTASGTYNFIGNGRLNITNGSYNIIVGGNNNQTYGNHSNVLGGSFNRIAAYCSTIVGGINNVINGAFGFIAGGQNNYISPNLENISILGSNITLNSVSPENTTYVNNLTSQGLVYDRNGNSTNWNAAYTGFTNISLSSNKWNSTYTTVCANSASWQNPISYGDTVYAKISSAPFTLNVTTSSIYPLRGNNLVTGNLSFIGGGSANDTKGFANTFIFGSNLSAVKANYVYVNNLSSQGLVYANGGSSENWNSVYSTVCANSAKWDGLYNYVDTNFLKLSASPFVLNLATSSIKPQLGNNIASGVLSFIAAGSGNDTRNFRNTFILGSNLSAYNEDFTYVNNLSSDGVIYDKKGSSNNWNSVYSTVCANSSVWGGWYDYVISNFLKLSAEPYTLISATSSIKPSQGTNTSSGYMTFILGGSGNNTNNQVNTFIVGSNLKASKPDFTYVNNLSTCGAICGNFYGNGENLSLNSNNIKGITYKYGTATGSIIPISGVNVADGIFSNIGGGCKNYTVGKYSVIVGGCNSTASGCYSVIGGGESNCICQGVNYGSHASIVGGKNNMIYGKDSTIAGGAYNTSSGYYAVIGGGKWNNTSSAYSFIAGGQKNSSNNQVNTFILGSGLSAHRPDFTYVNNLSTNGLLYDLNGDSNHWNSVYSTVCANSATWGGGATKDYVDTTFLKLSASPFVLNIATSSINPKFGGNLATGLLSFIGGGSANDTKFLNNTFIFGSRLSADQLNFTYVNNISSQGAVCGTFYGDGYNITNLNIPAYGLAGDIPYVYGSNAHSIKPKDGINTSSGLYSVVAGGNHNSASGNYSNINGGGFNCASNTSSVVAGGIVNCSTGYSSFIGGGNHNCATGGSVGGTVVAGGAYNCSTGSLSFIGGGLTNTASGYYATIGGGYGNCASGDDYSTVAGGGFNTASARYSIVAGGGRNCATGIGSNVVGGCRNIASGACSSILGGANNNTNSQTNAHIIGSGITASQADTTFVNNLIASGYMVGSVHTTVLTPSDTTYNLALIDNGGVVVTKSTTTMTINVNNATTYPAGYQVTILQNGSARAQIAGLGGITINQANNYTKLTKQYAAATLVYDGTTWVIFGDLAV